MFLCWVRYKHIHPRRSRILCSHCTHSKKSYVHNTATEVSGETLVSQEKNLQSKSCSQTCSGSAPKQEGRRAGRVCSSQSSPARHGSFRQNLPQARGLHITVNTTGHKIHVEALPCPGIAQHQTCLATEHQDITSCISRDAGAHSLLSRQRGKHAKLFSPCPPRCVLAPLRLHPLVPHPAVTF